MAVDDEERRFQRSEFLSREVVRLAAMVLMRHPTYQGVFMRNHFGSFFDAYQQWNDDYVYDGEDNRDSIVRAAHDLARHSISMLDSSGTNFIYEPRTDVNFGSAATNESTERAGVDVAGGEDVSRNEGDPNVRRDRDIL